MKQSVVSYLARFELFCWLYVGHLYTFYDDMGLKGCLCCHHLEDRE